MSFTIVSAQVPGHPKVVLGALPTGITVPHYGRNLTFQQILTKMQEVFSEEFCNKMSTVMDQAIKDNSSFTITEIQNVSVIGNTPLGVK